MLKDGLIKRLVDYIRGPSSETDLKNPSTKREESFDIVRRLNNYMNGFKVNNPSAFNPYFYPPKYQQKIYKL